MSNSSSSYDLNNNQLLLINILNTMYNDNIRQINNYNDSITLLNQNNIQIRNLLFQIFYNSNNSNITNNTNNSNNTNNNSNFNQNFSRNNRENYGTNTFRNTNYNNLGRVFLNNIPYVIENIEEYRIPLRRDRNEQLNSNYSQLLQNFLQPIEVFPTQSQIEISTRVVRFNDIISPRNRSCPISLENFNDTDLVTVIRFCGHIFNTDELNTWFRSNCRCPVCRYDIRTFNSNLTPGLFDDANRNENSLEQIYNSNLERSELSNSNSTHSTPLINRFLNNLETQENEIINLFTDLSGNLFNNITNSDSLLRLFNSVNNNYSI